jgi:hypothetical protein
MNDMNSKNHLTGLFIGLILLIATGCRLPVQPEPADNLAQLVSTIQVHQQRTLYPTATDYPTQTPYPTYSDSEISALYPSETPEPTLTPVRLTQYPRRNEILVNPGVWSRDLRPYAFCGDEFAVKIGYKDPYFGFAIGNEVSQNQFLFVNLMVWNMSDHAIPLIFHKQFMAAGESDGKILVSQSFGPAGISASNRWGVHFLSSQAIPAGIELETWLVFDVNYHAENWKLIFEADDSADFDCQFALDIPQPNFPINFYQTAEANQ